MPNPKQRNGEAPDPKPKGGRRGGTRREVSAASLANLRSLPKGVSGNPSGKSTSLNTIMRQAREHAPEVIESLLSIIRDPKAAHRDVIQACLALLDRGLGKPVVPIFRGSSSGLPDDMITGCGADGETTVLLNVAGRGPGEDYRQMLVNELAKIDAEEAQARAERKDEVDEAKAAMARGEPVSPLLKMLVEVRDATE